MPGARFVALEIISAPRCDVMGQILPVLQWRRNVRSIEGALFYARRGCYIMPCTQNGAQRM